MIKVGDKVIILPSAVDISVPGCSVGNTVIVYEMPEDKQFWNCGYRGYTYEVRVHEEKHRYRLWRLRDCDFEECVPVGKQLEFDFMKEEL